MKALIPVLIVLGIIAFIGMAVVGQYNGLVRQDVAIQGQWAQVNNQLQRRNDLIPNLVNTVKGIAGQEQKVYGEIAEARSRMAGAASKPVGEQIDAAHQMDGAIGRLLVVMENYPQLRSQENFSQLQAQLEGTENRLATERMRYNELVTTYNTTVKSFPLMLFAGMLGFKDKPFYPVPEAATKNPTVQF